MPKREYTSLIQKPVASGTYGEVFHAADKEDGTHVAYKRIKVESKKTMEEWRHEAKEFKTNWCREVNNLKRLQGHPHIIQLLDKDVYERALVFEWLEGGDLWKYIHKEHRYKTIPQKTVNTIMIQLLSALDHCHQKRIMHRDLRPSNILIVHKDPMTIKLADFGQSRRLTSKTKNLTHLVCALPHRAVELLLGAPVYDTAVDMWSVGCTYAEMCRSNVLWHGDDEVEQMMLIFKALGTPTEETWPGVTKYEHYNKEFPQFKPADEPLAKGVDDTILRRFLVYPPTKRITAGEALTLFINERDTNQGTK
jgi:serine/threonine protein kinase